MMDELIKDLKEQMSLTRLSKVGLFQKLPYDDDDPIYMECASEIQLHRTVLDKALLDSFSQSDEVRKDVEDWLYIDNPDFREACERALLEPDRVFAVFKVMKKIIVGKNAKFREFGKPW